MSFIDTTPELEYDDVFITPNFSSLKTRKEANISSVLRANGAVSAHTGVLLRVPLISSNMDTVTEEDMAIAMHQGGGMGALHRYVTIDKAVQQYKAVADANSTCFVSVGVIGDYKERSQALYEAGARLFIVDIAHGHSILMKNAVRWLKNTYGGNVFVMGGNIGTVEALHDLAAWGVDAVKVGIASGSVCDTKNVTGVLTPMFSTIRRLAREQRDYQRVAIVADGGAKNYGDVAKALGAGAHAVMSGHFFAGCPETPKKAVVENSRHELKHRYRGMASYGAMAENEVRGKAVEALPTPEGREVMVAEKPSAKVILEQIAGGLRSSLSYVGVKNLEDFEKQITFGIKHNR